MSTRRRRWLALAAAAAVAVLVGAAGAWWLSREKPPRPPAIDLADADPLVAALVEAARKDVAAEPRSGRSWGHLGMVLRAHDYGSEANVCFEQAERLDPRVHLGLGMIERIEELRIDWPDGLAETFPAPELDRYLHLERGKGKKVDR